MPAPSEKQIEPAVLEDWGSFQIAMLSNEAYQRVSQLSTDKLAVSRLETFFSVQGEQLQVAVQLWALMLNGVSTGAKPDGFEVGQWRAIARATHMPVSFDDDGFLTVNDDS